MRREYINKPPKCNPFYVNPRIEHMLDRTYMRMYNGRNRTYMLLSPLEALA